MNKGEVARLLKLGKISAWNQLRKRSPDWHPDLTGEKISADLAYADLTYADLRGADLSGAGLFDLKRARVYRLGAGSATQFKGALINGSTRFPEGFDAVEAGALFEPIEFRRRGVAETSVFISYAWVEKRVALALDAWLRSRGLQTKLDRRDFFAGARIRDEIFRVMAKCNAIVICYSEAASEKAWTTFERELASDLEMEAKTVGLEPPLIVYLVLDSTPLPGVLERARLAVMAKGRGFEDVCAELFRGIMRIPDDPEEIDLREWDDYVF